MANKVLMFIHIFAVPSIIVFTKDRPNIIELKVKALIGE